MFHLSDKIATGLNNLFNLVILVLYLCAVVKVRARISWHQETLKTIQAWKLTVNSLRHWRFSELSFLLFPLSGSPDNRP